MNKKKGVGIIILGILGIVGTMLLFFYLQQSDSLESENFSIPTQKQYPRLEEAYNSFHQNMILGKVQSLENKNTTGIKLLVAIPEFWLGENFLSLQKKLKDNHNIIVQYVKIPTLKIYQAMIQNRTIKNIDLLLVPYEWRSAIKAQKLDIDSSLESFFLPITHSIIQKEYLIPFGLDPVVSWNNNPQNLPNTKIDTIINYYTLWRGSKYQTPTIDTFSEDYFSLILYYIQKYKKEKLFSHIQDLYILEKQYQSTAHHDEMINVLKKKDKQCIHFPEWCLLVYGFTDHKYGFFSEQDIPLKKQWTKKIGIFPYFQNIYPSRLRVRLHPADSKNSVASKEFIRTLMIDFSYDSMHFIPTQIGKSHYEKLKLFHQILGSDTTMLGIIEQINPKIEEIKKLMQDGKKMIEYSEIL